MNKNTEWARMRNKESIHRGLNYYLQLFYLYIYIYIYFFFQRSTKKAQKEASVLNCQKYLLEWKVAQKKSNPRKRET